MAMKYVDGELVFFEEDELEETEETDEEEQD